MSVPVQECILLVESDVLIRRPLAEYLRECGYRVIEARDAHEARQVLTNGAAKVHIVLADIDQPAGSGFALAGWIRTDHPEIQVLLAGTIAKATEKASDLCDQGPHVSKPYDHQLVLDRIKRSLAARERSGE